MKVTMTPTPVTHIKNIHPDYVGLTMTQAETIKLEIKQRFGTCAEFCRQYKVFKLSSLCELLRCEKKTDPKKLAKLKKILGVEF